MTDAMVRLDDHTLGYEVRADSGGPRPGVLIIHEVTGLIDHIKETARSLADKGFSTLAVDLYEGRTAKGMEDGAPIRDTITDEVLKTKMGAGARYLRSRSYCAGKVGVIGFCMGGGFSLRTACLLPDDIQACVVFYGRIPDLKLLKGLKAPVLGNFGEEDKGITGWAVGELNPEMQRLGKSLDMKIYPGAPHGFGRHTDPKVYRPEAAKDAFQRTAEFFARHLK
jgi:carboxymethylenebutenolidase